jgi:hypothetical protein
VVENFVARMDLKCDSTFESFSGSLCSQREQFLLVTKHGSQIAESNTSEAKVVRTVLSGRERTVEVS